MTVMNRIGKIVYICENTGRGALVDDLYHDKLYKFIATDYEAGQYVIYDTTNLNPITGYRECTLIAPKLWEGTNSIYAQKMADLQFRKKYNNSTENN